MSSRPRRPRVNAASSRRRHFLDNAASGPFYLITATGPKRIPCQMDGEGISFAETTYPCSVIADMPMVARFARITRRSARGTSTRPTRRTTAERTSRQAAPRRHRGGMRFARSITDALSGALAHTGDTSATRSPVQRRRRAVHKARRDPAMRD